MPIQPVPPPEQFRILLAAVGTPGARILVAFQSYRFRDRWVRDFAEPLTLAGGRFNPIACRWTFANGSQIDLPVLAEEHDIHKIRAREYTDCFTPEPISNSSVLQALSIVVRKKEASHESPAHPVSRPHASSPRAASPNAHLGATEDC